MNKLDYWPELIHNKAFIDMQQECSRVIRAAYAELDEAILASMAAGVPASHIIIRRPYQVETPAGFDMRSGLGFIPDWADR